MHHADRLVSSSGSFNDYFDKPVVICIRKSPGATNETTSIWVDGKEMPLAETSSSRRPNVKPTDIRIGGGLFTSDMVVGEVIVYDRALPDRQANVVGSYLTEKFRLDTAYSAGDKSFMPDKLPGLCAWFKEPYGIE